MSKRFPKLAGIFTALHLFLFVGIGFGSIWFDRQSLIERICQAMWLALIQPVSGLWDTVGTERTFFNLPLAVTWTLLILNSALWGTAIALFSVTRSRALRAAGLVSFAIIVLVAWDPWPAHYTGGGSFTDRGRYSYPRYVVTFPDIPLYESSERRFRFQGLPSEEMALKLYLKDWPSGGSDKAERLRHLRITIEVTLRDSDGRQICHASGAPEFDKLWVLTEGGGRAAFYHLQCANVRVRRGHSYELTFQVTRTARDNDVIVVTPTLEGGGEENADD